MMSNLTNAHLLGIDTERVLQHFRRVTASGMLQKFGFIFRSQRFSFCSKVRLGFLVEFWGRGRAGCDGHAYLGEEVFLSGRRADA